MVPLRAYLMHRRAVGEWNVRVHRDLESIESDWRETLSANQQSLALLHIGFWRPDPQEVDRIIGALGGRLLVTEAARHALDPKHTSVGTCVGRVDNVPLYIVTSGWGYVLDEAEISNVHRVSETASVAEDHLFATVYRTKPDWLEALRHRNAELHAEAQRLGVVDELTYLRNEAALTDALRDALGWERYLYYSCLLPDVGTVIDTLRYAPPWMLERSLLTMDLSVRSTNALKTAGIEKVKDLAKIGTDGLYRIDNLGSKSRREIAERILSCLISGPWLALDDEAAAIVSTRQREIFPDSNLPRPFGARRRRADPATNASTDNLRFADVGDLLERCLDQVPEKHRAILRARMGLLGDVPTLEDLGRQYGVTRERIRQIESRACGRIRRLAAWEHDLCRRLAATVDENPFPVSLDGLDALDPWFRGLGALRVPFAYALKNFCDAKFSLIEIEGQTIVCRVTQAEWVNVLNQANDIIAGLAGLGTTELQARLAVEGLLPPHARSLREALWEAATRRAHFANSSTDRILVSVGQGVEHAVQAILAEAAEPLYYAEIAMRCSERLGRKVDVRRVHSAAGNVGLLYGRGIYGLEHHLPVSDDEAQTVLAAAEYVVASGAIGKQWHAREILSAIEEEFPDIPQVNPYVLCIVLKRSSTLVGLGRMVWTMRESGAIGAGHRIDVRQAIVALLQRIGRPMGAQEIRDELSRDRGLNVLFQIHPDELLIRVAPGRWGLVDRDVPYGVDEIERIVAALDLVLREKAHGLHVSEIIPQLSARLPTLSLHVDPIMIMDLGRIHGPMSVARGQILYLTEWGEPRRLTVMQAVKEIFEDCGDLGLTTDEIHARVERKLARPVERNLLASYCDDCATFSADTGKWTPVSIAAID